MPEIDHDAAERKAFEAWISAPPYEKETHRQGQSNPSWPGQYHVYEVQLAWEAWKQSAEQAKGLAEALRGALKSIEDSYDALKRGGGQVPLSLLKTMNACRSALARYEESKR